MQLVTIVPVKPPFQTQPTGSLATNVLQEATVLKDLEQHNHVVAVLTRQGTGQVSVNPVLKDSTVQHRQEGQQ